jgi:hypothetical protein
MQHLFAQSHVAKLHVFAVSSHVCINLVAILRSLMPCVCCGSCRKDIRLVSNNATHVAASQREVEYLAYWNVMFSSTDPALKDEAAWLQRGPGITVWEVRRDA